MRTEHTRSIQTISHSTEVIDSFFDELSQKEFSVRRLSFRHDLNRQIFIVTISNDKKSDDFYVVPFAELSYRRNKINVIVDPKAQYPELCTDADSAIELIKSSIMGYMSQYNRLFAH
ncbi:hypothetical protein [Photorhabdus temperata]|uniref:Uncharacterized protein n=2 Tax=Photorhabdus temperata TaxID=574560 RepID=A0A081RS60_PHOTE|nr:hypothetical protein [Photorhabdus temperata]ERT11939.1 hypothetical protein O185_16830 [Photorhabdus temperata J3]KER01513.1 hypothetical protein MEG1DRAFT_03878 [Photorhabdus temperata subsp. temperata Meg1]